MERNTPEAFGKNEWIHVTECAAAHTLSLLPEHNERPLFVYQVLLHAHSLLKAGEVP